jgi:hypothetical protein
MKVEEGSSLYQKRSPMATISEAQPPMWMPPRGRLL